MWLRWVRRMDLGRSLFAAVFPEFIAREEPGPRGRGRQGRSAGLVRPAAQRGLGPARLDGQAPRATVAGESDELGGRRSAAQGQGDALKTTPRGERPRVPVHARSDGFQPIRRSLVGSTSGAPNAVRRGWADQPIPWRASAARRRQPTAGRERWKPAAGETRAARLDAQHDSAAGIAGDALFSGMNSRVRRTAMEPDPVTQWAIHPVQPRRACSRYE